MSATVTFIVSLLTNVAETSSTFVNVGGVVSAALIVIVAPVLVVTTLSFSPSAEAPEVTA